MRLIDEFRDPRLAAGLISAIQKACEGRPLRLMEVCGTHTVAIFRSGLRQLLEGAVELVSGPGCPVCVTAQRDIDFAIGLAEQPGVTLTTFGDMIKVPGTRGSLQQARARGADVRIVYSPAYAVQLAAELPDRQVVFLGVGFETTAPIIAASLLEARRRGLHNYLVHSVHKVVPPALRALAASGEVALDGLILPGHVSTVIGLEPYRFLATEYNLPSVIAGFEPLDILQAVHRLATARDEEAAVTIEYRRAVRPEGNPVAVQLMESAFVPADAHWRGLGIIPASGLQLREEYAAHDAARVFPVDVSFSREPAGCACVAVLRGGARPPDCRLFATTCTPEHPIGPCMVSTEGTCAAYYAYGRD